MKPFKRTLCSFYGAIIIYLLLNLVLGESGVLEKRKLAGYMDMLNRNIYELQRIGNTLSGHSTSLRTDPDMVALLARELGYRRQDEILVHLHGYNGPPERYTVGRTLTRTGTSSDRDTIFRSLALTGGIVIFFCLTLAGRKNDANKRLR